MSDVFKDAGSSWGRLFDHKVFLNGEIQFVLREFEQRHGDREVPVLFDTLEKVIDVKDTQVDRAKDYLSDTLPRTKLVLGEALNLCDEIKALELRHHQSVDQVLKSSRLLRNTKWEKFVDGMSDSCAQIDAAFLQKEAELDKLYSDLESKLSTH